MIGKKIYRRADHIHDFAEEVRKSKEELARTMTKEMGRPIKEARAEVEKCAWVMDYFANNGKIFLNDEVINTDARKSVVTFEPLGVIGSIMPWNFPYWQGLRFGATFAIRLSQVDVTVSLLLPTMISRENCMIPLFISLSLLPP